MPGSAFGVSSWPEPSVHRDQARRAVGPAAADRAPRRLVVAPRAGDADWITETINAALGGLPVRPIEPTLHGPKWWGTSKLVEGVVYPVDVPELARRPDGRRRAVGVPLVQRADRPLAVPVLRPPRPARPPPAHGRGAGSAGALARRPQEGRGA
jgi:hypothetical protein